MLKIEFTSDRKRSSIIYRKDDKIILYCKGADNAILSLLAENQDLNYKEFIINKVDYFSK